MRLSYPDYILFTGSVLQIHSLCLSLSPLHFLPLPPSHLPPFALRRTFVQADVFCRLQFLRFLVISAKRSSKSPMKNSRLRNKITDSMSISVSSNVISSLSRRKVGFFAHFVVVLCSTLYIVHCITDGYCGNMILLHYANYSFTPRIS